MNEEKNIILDSLKDFFTLKMFKFSILPFILSIVILYMFFFWLIGIGLDGITADIQTTQTTIEDGVAHTQSESFKFEGSSILNFLMTYILKSWIASFLVYIIGAFAAIYASVFVAIIIIGFLTPFILKEVQLRHYRDIALSNSSNLLPTLISTLKYLAVMIALFILLIPLYFIPFLNMIAINIPLYYFFHKMLLLDVSSTICTSDEAKKIAFFSKNTLMIKTLMLYLISLIPFSIFFTSVLFVIYLGHTYFLEVKKIRVA